MAVGTGVDATNANSAQIIGGSTTTENAGQNNLVNANYMGYPGIGYHYIAWLEVSAGASTTWYGDNGSFYVQTGLSAEVMG